MEIKINITKVRFFLIVGLAVVIGATFFVQGFGEGTPGIVGHRSDDIDWSQTVPSGIVVDGSVRSLAGTPPGRVEMTHVTPTRGSVNVASGHELSLQDGGDINLFISGVGDIGIGGTPSGVKLDVFGVLRSTGAIVTGPTVTNSLQFGDGTTQTTSAGPGLCQIVTASSGTGIATVTCGSGRLAISGGGNCPSASVVTSCPATGGSCKSSGAPGEQWRVSCSTSVFATAYAVCCRA